MTCIEIGDSLRGSSWWERKPTDKSICENPDLAECSVEVVDETATQRLRVKEESYKAYIEEELSLRKRRKKIIKPAFGGVGQQVNGAGIGDVTNSRVPE